MAPVPVDISKAFPSRYQNHNPLLLSTPTSPPPPLYSPISDVSETTSTLHTPPLSPHNPIPPPPNSFLQELPDSRGEPSKIPSLPDVASHPPSHTPFPDLLSTSPSSDFSLVDHGIPDDLVQIIPFEEPININLYDWSSDEIPTYTAEELASVDPSLFFHAETELAASSVAEDLDFLDQEILVNALQLDAIELQEKTSREPTTVTNVTISSSATARILANSIVIIQELNEASAKEILSKFAEETNQKITSQITRKRKLLCAECATPLTSEELPEHITMGAWAPGHTYSSETKPESMHRLLRTLTTVNQNKLHCTVCKESAICPDSGSIPQWFLNHLLTHRPSFVLAESLNTACDRFTCIEHNILYPSLKSLLLHEVTAHHSINYKSHCFLCDHYIPGLLFHHLEQSHNVLLDCSNCQLFLSPPDLFVHLLNNVNSAVHSQSAMDSVSYGYTTQQKTIIMSSFKKKCLGSENCFSTYSFIPRIYQKKGQPCTSDPHAGYPGLRSTQTLLLPSFLI